MNNFKKFFHLTIGAFLCFSILRMFKVNTYAKSDEYEYVWDSLTGEGICLTKYKGSDEIVHIPDKVDGYTVFQLSSTFFCNTTVKEVFIPSTVKSIGYSVFYETENLTEVHIPDSVEMIGREAFEKSGLKRLTIPSSVTSIQYAAFKESKLEEITLPPNLSVLKEHAFIDCKNLKSIVIQGSISEIGELTFNGCTSLKEIIIPEGITSIGREAFRDCTSLTKVRLPESLRTIGASAFQGCTALNEIAIPDKVNNVRTVFPPNTTLIVNPESYLETDLGVKVEPKKDISAVPIRFSNQGYVYTGKAIQPLKITGLEENSDYTVTYQNNVKIGRASATVKGIGKYTGQVSGVTFKIVPGQVSGIRQSGCTKTQATIEWNACGGGVDGYEVEKSNINNESWSLLKNVTASSFKDRALKPGVKYKYRVRAYKAINGKKFYGAYSDTLIAQTVPEKVTNFKCTQSKSTKIQLKWDSQKGVSEGYLIYKYNVNKGKYILAKTLDGSSRYSWTNNYLKSNTEYRYKICSFITINGKKYYSDFSDELHVTTAPIRPKFRLISDKKGQITVTWDKVEGATGYVLFYKTEKNGAWKALTNNKFTGNSYTKKYLKSGKKYYFYLRAVNNYNGTLIKSGTYFKEKTVK